MTRLEEIRNEMLELLEEAKQIVRMDCSKITYERMKAYWHPHIQMSLTNEHDYMGKEMFTMQDAIDELDCNEQDEDEELEMSE